jgi:branched-chain amino acid transport system substrate-binding protein
MMGPTPLCIGAVVPRTGRLSRLGDPLAFVIDRSAAGQASVRGADGRLRPLRFTVRDSRSDPAHAREAVRGLVAEDGADIVVAMAGTRVLPAVVGTCEELRVPCLSTTFPWQAFARGRAAAADGPFPWSHHFAWGLDDIAEVFAEMWGLLGPGRTVGCLWNDDLQGRLLREVFAPTARERGHTLVDPGGYAEPATDLSAHVDRILRGGADVVTSAATADDLALFIAQARAAGLRPRLLTCSRWLAYPHTHAGAELSRARVATLVYWTPRHPFRSSLDGTTAAELATAYEAATGTPWLQPLGLACALVEVAHHALASAEDPGDRASVAAALSRTRLATMAGTLDFTRGPAPGIARVPLAGGQWHPTRDGHALEVVTNTAVPEVAVTADLAPAT